MKIEEITSESTVGIVAELSNQDLIVLKDLSAMLMKDAPKSNKRSRVYVEVDLLKRVERFVDKLAGDVKGMREVECELFDLDADGKMQDIEQMKEEPKVIEGIDLKERQFHIHHMSKIFSTDSDAKYAGFVMAVSLEDAFKKSQNENEAWGKGNNRSTSVGDIIQDNKRDFYRVMDNGFELLIESSMLDIEQIEGNVPDSDWE